MPNTVTLEVIYKKIFKKISKDHFGRIISRDEKGVYEKTRTSGKTACKIILQILLPEKFFIDGPYSLFENEYGKSGNGNSFQKCNATVKGKIHENNHGANKFYIGVLSNICKEKIRIEDVEQHLRKIIDDSLKKYLNPRSNLELSEIEEIIIQILSEDEFSSIREKIDSVFSINGLCLENVYNYLAKVILYSLLYCVEIKELPKNLQEQIEMPRERAKKWLGFECSENHKKEVIDSDKEEFFPRCPLYIDERFADSIFEQLEVYEPEDVVVPTFEKNEASWNNFSLRSTILTNYCVSRGARGRINKILKMIKGTIKPVPVYNAFVPKLQNNIVHIRGVFILEGIYTDKNPEDLSRMGVKEYSSQNYTWHFVYKNVGEDGTYYHSQDDYLKCIKIKGDRKELNISMYLNGDKFIMGSRHMTHQIKENAEFDLSVVGYVFKAATSDSYTIKPLAVDIYTVNY